MTWTAQTYPLSRLPIQDRVRYLPPHLQRILDNAGKWGLKPLKIWIFGSRARGDARENSDFDLAFQISDKTHWSHFVLEIAEEPPALYKYDLVDIDQADNNLKQAISTEGILIYDSK